MINASVPMIFLSLFASFLYGCNPLFVRSTTNSMSATPPKFGTYTLSPDESTRGDPVMSSKLEIMIHHQLRKMGFRKSKNAQPDFKVFYSYNVSHKGAVSTGITSINNPSTTTTLHGNTATTNPYSSLAVTTRRTTTIYQKTIRLRFVGENNQAPLWQATTTEEGWCNNIIVTAPEIISAMFDRYPENVTNLTKSFRKNERSIDFHQLFPPDTNWGCR